jgi:hypothetical protein
MEEREKSSGSVPARRNLSQRFTEGAFTFPFGVYPEGSFHQRTAYDSKYLEVEGCFYYQLAVSHERLLDVFTALLNQLPSTVYLVTKIHSGDYYRDHDTYISEEEIPRQRLLSWLRDWRDVVADDGFFGFGMFAEGATHEVFIDEHKTIHVYHHDPALMEKTFEGLNIPFAFDLRFFWDEPHYHEPLPYNDDYGDDYLTAFEDLADTYELYLDEDEEDNVDNEGAPLGMTCWKVEIRGYVPHSPVGTTPKGFYSTLFVNADSRREVVDLVEEYLVGREEQVDLFLQMARVPLELIPAEMSAHNPDPDEPRVWYETDRVIFDWSTP